jgi:hypothetical protein
VVLERVTVVVVTTTNILVMWVCLGEEGRRGWLELTMGGFVFYLP